MITLIDEVETGRDNQMRFLAVALAAHMLLMLLNPVVFKTMWRSITQPREATVVIVDIPGPTDNRMPGVASPQHGVVIHPPTPFHSTAPAASLGDSITPSAIANTGVLPLVSRPFHGMRLPDLPMQIDRTPIANSVTIPIAVGHAAAPNLESSSPSILVEHHGNAGMSPPLLHGDGGSGHVLIRYISPAPTAIESVRSPEAHTAKSTKGLSIEGPLSSRTVLHRMIPEYPGWAEEQNITGSVRLYFTVDSEGQVRPSILIRQTSGNSELDRLAVDALRAWKFSTSTDQDALQWGVITFNFSLERS